ncbi:uncharacterized protein LOC143001389 [Genypterus blacodes]|uniref:uncharacterized protein LOC143001389 n=1 Tax=Genypterus blacodes TaxID=154954 RepID=UPI003F75BF11
MKYRADFLCIWIVILLHSLDAAYEPKQHALASLCRPKQLAALTKARLKENAIIFDDAIGVWSPGFPALRVPHSYPLSWSKVQCRLDFMAQGLEEILEDQRSNMNPSHTSLHRQLKETIAMVYLLELCVQGTHGGECSSKLSPPKIPKQTFERKQWSHTMLKASEDYLAWLEDEVKIVQMSKVKEINHAKPKVRKVLNLKMYSEGSGYLP